MGEYETLLILNAAHSSVSNTPSLSSSKSFISTTPSLSVSIQTTTAVERAKL